MQFLQINFPLGGKRAAFALVLAFFAQMLCAQSSMLTGKVTDEKDPIVGASVKVTQGTNFVRGTVTDLEGNFRLSLYPGVYDLEVSYTGFQSQRITGCVVLEGQINKIPNVVMANSILSEVVVTSYKVPLIQQDNISGGQILTSDQIKNLPTRKVNALIATTPGTTTIDGGAVGIKGSRSNSGNVSSAEFRMIDPGHNRSIKPEKRKRSSQDLASASDSLPRERYSQEQYNTIVENPFQDAKASNISTFSIDVDGASYANVRRYLNNGMKPPQDAVRIEEMINYFDYQYNGPKGEHPFEANVEVAPCPWNPENRLMVIGLQGTDIDLGQLPASNFVFLIDVSGSMGSPDKLPLVKESLVMLTKHLRANDRVAIVVYAGAAGLVLESTAGTDQAKIISALEKLESGGSTAGGAGIQLAYNEARKNFIASGNNRVVLCTDGDFNVGLSSEDELVKLIEKERESGVYLTVLGFGQGNYQDGKMQMLANKGNGNHAYIDQAAEAQKVLIEEFGGTLFAIAKDVKLQLHFNADLIAGYRLIGYENRLLATEDFQDDTKDAGELGAGHRVTALYELVPKGQNLPALSKLDSAFVVSAKPDKSVNLTASDLMVLQLRYKNPKGKSPSKLMEYRLNAGALDRKTESENFKLAAGVAEFGMLLRDSKYKGSASYAQALSYVRQAMGADVHGYRKELVGLLENGVLNDK